MNPLSESDAAAIWQVLVDHAGAPEDERFEFVRYANRGEIHGWSLDLLGFSGAFHLVPGNWHVDCDPEDETPERQAVIEKTNEALAELRKESA